MGVGPVGPPDVGTGVITSIAHLAGYVVFYMVHIVLQVIMIILGGIVLMNPYLLRITGFDLVLAGIAIIDLIISRGL